MNKIINAYKSIFQRYQTLINNITKVLHKKCQKFLIYKILKKNINKAQNQIEDLTKTISNSDFWIKESIEQTKEDLIFIKKIYIKIKNKVFKFFERNPEQKYRIKKIIEDWVNIDLLYWLQLMASVVLATFWLLTNSNPVIIWAMLIAPLLQPIQALSFSIATWRLKLYRKSLKILFLSIIFAIVWAFILTSLVPFGWLTNEILSRTNPTILDLWVAFVSWLIAFLVLWYKKLSWTIVWAAIAASLLPPLSATWIGIKFMNLQVAWWTFLLFLANLVAIIFAGLFMFWLYNFKATNKEWKNRRFYQYLIMIITWLLISVPLRMSMKQITNDIYIKNSIETSLNTTLPTINPHIQLVSFKVKEKTDKKDILIVLKVPDWDKITLQDKSLISKHLANVLNSPVDVQIQVIPITSVYNPQKKELSLKDKIHIFLADYVPKNYSQTYIVNFIFKPLSGKNLVYLELYNEKPININDFIKNLENILKDKFWWDFIVKVTWDIKQKTDQNQVNELEQELKDQFSYLFPKSEIRNFKYIEKTFEDWNKTLIIKLDFISAKDKLATHLLLEKRKELLAKKMKIKVKIISSILYKEFFEK